MLTKFVLNLQNGYWFLGIKIVKTLPVIAIRLAFENVLSLSPSLSLSLLFYFHNARWIYLRPGRAISLDRKFNTADTEASIKIDEMFRPMERIGFVAEWYYSQKHCFLAGKISRQTAKDSKNTKRPVKRGFTLIACQGTEDVSGRYLLLTIALMIHPLFISSLIENHFYL